MSSLDGAVLYDLSEFVRSPLRTGIQRVSLEIMLNWPGTARLHPIYLSPDGAGVRLLPPDFSDVMRAMFDGRADEADISAITHQAELVEWDRFWRFSKLLNPEVFFDPARARFYRWVCRHRQSDVHWIVHDFLPWLSPEVFSRNSSAHTMYYLQAMRDAGNLHFTSGQAREQGMRRVLRRGAAEHHVHPLGGDALGRARPAFVPENRRLACVGTIEPRKQQGLVIDVAQSLWDDGNDFELVIVGRAGWSTRALQDRMRLLEASEPRFRWIESAGDQDVRRTVMESRATIFASELEGYGLPPLESLSLGVPAIASARLPSLESVADLGCIRLAHMDATSLREAMLRMLDDDVAARLRAEAAELNLPTWRSYCSALAAGLELRVA